MNNLETISIVDAAAIMHCSAWTVRDLIKSGELPATRIGRPFVLLRNDVLNYVREKIHEGKTNRDHWTEVNREYAALIS